MAKPSLSRITVYPIKSFDGHDLPTVAVLASGALAGDRQYALVDSDGKYVNAKRYAAIHRVRSTYSEDLKSVTLASQGQQRSFVIAEEQEALAVWCSEILDVPCRLVENTKVGFPDDVDSPGPTLVSTASLEVVASWFEGVDLAEARRRFRFNLEVADTSEFWEDRLVGEVDEKQRSFRIGGTAWQGRGMCQRCAVPARDSVEGLATTGFAREFAGRREETLPGWSPKGRFDHFYRFGVNTAIDFCDSSDALSVGDVID